MYKKKKVGCIVIILQIFYGNSHTLILFAIINFKFFMLILLLYTYLRLSKKKFFELSYVLEQNTIKCLRDGQRSYTLTYRRLNHNPEMD